MIDMFISTVHSIASPFGPLASQLLVNIDSNSAVIEQPYLVKHSETMGIGSSSLLSLSGEGWAVAHVGIRTGLATNILVLFNRHRLAQQRKLSKDGRPAITATSSALLGSANQCLVFFALSVVAQSHLNQGQDSPFPAPSQYIMQ